MSRQGRVGEKPSLCCRKEGSLKIIRTFVCKRNGAKDRKNTLKLFLHLCATIPALPQRKPPTFFVRQTAFIPFPFVPVPASPAACRLKARDHALNIILVLGSSKSHVPVSVLNSVNMHGWLNDRSRIRISKLAKCSWRHLHMIRFWLERKPRLQQIRARRACSSTSKTRQLSRMTFICSATACALANIWSNSTCFIAKVHWVVAYATSPFLQSVQPWTSLTEAWAHHALSKRLAKCSFTCGSNGRFRNNCKT